MIFTETQFNRLRAILGLENMKRYIPENDLKRIMKLQDQRDIIQAALDGKIIESKLRNNSEATWINRSNCTELGVEFNFVSFEYRVKPEPREFFINEYPRAGEGSDFGGTLFDTAEAANKGSYSKHNKVVRLREVLD
jgi:hypothetical protein